MVMVMVIVIIVTVGRWYQNGMITWIIEIIPESPVPDLSRNTKASKI